MQLIRNTSDYSKEDWLFYLYNKLGYSDLSICSNYIRNGDLLFSRWIRYDELMEMDYSKKKWLINKATHRTILDIEILFDIDDVYMPIGDSQFRFNSIKAKSQYIFKRLYQLKKNPVCYFTGNKSYHISILEPSLRTLKKQDRSTKKEITLKAFGGDLMKKSDRCMIAMENTKHYRSGKPKELIQWNLKI